MTFGFPYSYSAPAERAKLKNFNLVHEKWVPVKRLNGEFEAIAPFEITSQHDINPIVGFAWPRPDFDLASHEFLIGLLSAISPADPHESKEWKKLFYAPPSPPELAAAFEPFADAFALDGDGPRFLQDFDALDGEELPVESLFIEAPGVNTTKLNKDLFVKRGQSRVLSRAAAALALYTLQQFAPSGGKGHRTSLRGGGPLVTLALPDGGQTSRPTLWQRLWLNTPADLRLDPPEKSKAFPWLAQTRTSAKKETVHEADAQRLQAFFGMPRRIRLVLTENPEKRSCDLTGIVDETLSLRRDASLMALAPLLVPPGNGAHAGAAHRLIWAAFADGPERKRDFLWRQDDKRRWFVLSSRLPSDPHQLFEAESKPFAPLLEKGDRLTFALRANAVVTRKDEEGSPKRCDVVMDRLRAFPKGERAAERSRLATETGRDWLAAQGAKAGFRLDRADVIAYRTEKIPRQRQKPIELGVLDLEGDMTIEAPELFLPALAAGFGKAKSFGCGLMLIRRRR